MIQIDNKIFQELAKKHGVHLNIVRSICMYPFLFSKQIMEDPTDEKSIMFHKLFKIKLKPMFNGKKEAPYVNTKVAKIKEAREKNGSNNK